MDDNENVIDFQKMNFSTFTSQLANISGNHLNQFSNPKITNTVPQQNSQLVVSGAGGNFHYVRTTSSHETSNPFAQQTNSSSLSSTATSDSTNISDSPLITLPITMPGSKPGDAQQTVHIQVMNPNALQTQTTKFQMGQMSIPTLQSFQPNGTTVLTVAYNPTDGKFISNGFPEGMTVVAALQPQDLQMLAQAQQMQIQQHHQQFLQQPTQDLSDLQNQQIESPILQNVANEQLEDTKHEIQMNEITVKQEPSEWDSSVSQNPSDYNDFMQSQSFNLNSFLKFPGNIKLENEVTSPPDTSSQQPSEQLPAQLASQHISNTSLSNEEESKDEETDLKGKRRRKAKKKPPKPKQPKPGQVLIATAIDGTTLFCCPECQMAYPEKENLEQHLTEHKIERRYICDICGAGLKRKEHLERHKSGHNPDRPYICSVCLKGFKRKEHLNLHFVIHSGEKNEVCGECGKGFYRKDHLRKHANSHVAKRLKEEMNARAAGLPIPTSSTSNINNINEFKTSSESSNANNTLVNSKLFTSDSDILNGNKNNASISNDNNSCVQIMNTQAAISLSTVYVPTSDNTTLPVQIQIPQMVTTCSSDGTTSTMILPTALESQNQALTT